jgi:hypothetical protein
MGCVPISVSFELLTDDLLTKVDFGLAKSCNDDGSSGWAITFDLQERQTPTGQFQEIVQLTVDVNVEDHNAAEKTARLGLTADQSDQALGAAALAAKDYKNGQGTLADAQEEVKGVLEVRDEGASA